MKDVLFALPGIVVTIVCWGSYGALLHRGQGHLGDRLKPLMCVGFAYVIFAVILPTIILTSTGKLRGGWNFGGISWSTAAGTLGAFGALGIILALSSGGKPIYVMPLVFGGAPIVNVVVAMYFQGLTPRDIGGRLPFFLAGVIMVAIGASMVLIFAPKAPAKTHAPETKPVATRVAPVDSTAPRADNVPSTEDSDVTDGDGRSKDEKTS